MNMLLYPVISLLNRFRFRTKFLLIKVIFLIPMLLFGYLLSTELRRTINTAELERQGLEYIEPLRQLVEHLAQHRGMTNIFLGGDNSFSARMNAKAIQVNKDFSALQEVDAQFGQRLTTGKEVATLQKQWQQLATSANSMSAAASFSKHTILIADVIDYTNTIGNGASLTSDPGADTNALAISLIKFIPVVVENIGQTRGGGAGAIAAGELSADKKLKLSLLTDRFNVAKQNMEKGFAHAFGFNPTLQVDLARTVEDAVKATENFRLMTEREILATSQITISASDYFALGTKAIAANLALYDRTLPYLSQMLQDRSDEAQSKEIAGAVIFIAVLVLLLYFFAALYQALQHGIDELLEAAHSLACGDLTYRIELQSKDEIADLAQALNRVAVDVGQSVRAITTTGAHLNKLGEQLLVASEHAESGVSKQVDEINQAATAINEMTTTVHDVAQNTSHTSVAADTAQQAAKAGRYVVGEAIGSINLLANEINEAAGVIKQLEESANSINSILESIGGIADQTNLLALNAAIEAARAGDQGRGFAVVADEVRCLAQRTQQSTQEIHQMLDQLHSGTDKAVAVMERSGKSAKESVSHAASAGEALQEITSTVATIHEMTTQIATAVEEQSAVTVEINRNICNVNEVARQTAQDAGASSEASQKVAALASEVRALLDRFEIDGEALDNLKASRTELMPWSDDLIVGIAEIDRQHQQLVSMMNELHHVLGRNLGTTAVQRVLKGLVNYTVNHFDYEERLMRKHGYPLADCDQHKQKHEALKAKVMAFKQRVDAGDAGDAGDADITDELLEFLKDWLVRHIQRSDKEGYVPVLIANGVS
ncbi:Methyl-accepting chemotaxis protein I (serine chemoreceptor protein) [hydrothermal vent metagenome]|uniref:Methyl-accepting chemotaxis protein I (Serine chemoreceptor protein) n=1 Tax=hydrothermal vent metagenome TaxID=652676 RepID=A0A3B1AU48_9ZZZZ